MAIVNQVLDFSSIRAATEPLSLAPTDPFLVAEEVAARLAVRAHERGIELGVICAAPDAFVPKVEANANALAPHQPRGQRDQVHAARQRHREATASKIVHRATRRAVTSGAWLVGMDGLTHAALRAQLISLGAHVESIEMEEATRRIGEGASPACILGADVVKMDDLARELVQRPASSSARVKVFAVARVGSPDEITGPRLGATPLRFPTTRAWLHQSLAGSEVSAAIVRSVKSQLHVLVAEDNAVNRQVMALLLNEAGITFDIAENGALAVEAVKRAASRPYDAILMDCQMPVMDGLEATRAIRAYELSTQSKRVPILAVTAHADIGQRDEILAAGMDAYLPKPLRLESLLRAIAPYAKRETLNPMAPLNMSALSTPVRALVAQDRIQELASLGDPQVVEELVQQFESDLEQADRDIAQSLAKDPPDRAQIRSVAHRIKGAALSLGAHHLSLQAATLEKSANDATQETLHIQAQAISHAIRPSVSALRDAFASASA